MSETRAALLRRRLIDLPLELNAATVHLDAVPLPSYPGEPRPSSTVQLAGGGEAGRGENVAWTREEHEHFAQWVENRDWTATCSLGIFCEQLATTLSQPYRRAAIESAAIDLALRQGNTNLGELCGTDFGDIRYVRSFASSIDPLPELRDHLEQAPEIGLKLDVHPAWAPETLTELARLEKIEVLDFKHRGSKLQQIRTAEVLQHPWLEDPGARGQSVSRTLADRFSLDAALTHEDPATILANLNPAAANLKVPRMGGVLNLLSAAAFCETRKKPFYMGGMFEVSGGRAQARELASLLAPQGPNDLAPLPRGPQQRFPLTLRPRNDGSGFGHR